GSYVPATVSDSGVLLYSNRGVGGTTTQIAWYDRSGKLLGPVGATGAVDHPAISPDEKSVAFDGVNGSSTDLWLIDEVSSGSLSHSQTASPPKMEMWGVPKEQVIETVANAGGHIIAMEEDCCACPEWTSFEYCVREGLPSRREK